VQVPETRYAYSGDVGIAYQVVGEGPFDVVCIPGADSHVEFIWQVPFAKAILDGIASYARLIQFDKRGTGMSDRVTGIADLETRMDDIRAVMDAAGSERAAIFGASEGVPLGILFAGTYPERCWALVLYGGMARMLRAPDYPYGRTEEEWRQGIARLRERWTTPGGLEEACRLAAPTAPPEEIQSLAAMMRYGLGPQAAEQLSRMNKEIDVRHALAAIRVPTIVMHRPTDTGVPIEHGRYIAQHIRGASFVALPGDGHVGAAAEQGPLIDEMRRFLERVWNAGISVEREPDRVLATVLFTDIVGSSERAVELGDRAWRELLERHHELVRGQLVRYRGVEIDTAGDGFFASFDGPARAIRCAQAVRDNVGALGIDVRAGLHTGECELVDGKVAGIAVHTGARVASLAQPGEVLVSSTVKDLVAGSGIEFEDRGVGELRGIPGEWRLFAVKHAN
jgi:class 3 adenylate cyclase/pimeloyl-ACP methyl ester carboxylesterase